MSVMDDEELEKNMPFDFDEDLLETYPELKSLSGMTRATADPVIFQEVLTISAAYSNLRTVERCLSAIKAGEHTIAIEYHLDSVVQALGQLALTGKYESFVLKEMPRCDEVARKARELIGYKVRGSDGVYR